MSTRKNNTRATVAPKAGHNSLAAGAARLATAIMSIDNTLREAATAQLRYVWDVARELPKVTEADWNDVIRDAVYDALQAKGYSEASARVKLSTYKAAVMLMASGKKGVEPEDGETWNAWRKRNGLVKSKGAASNAGQGGNKTVAEQKAAIEKAKADGGQDHAISMQEAAEVLTDFDGSTEAEREVKVTLTIFADNDAYEAFIAWANDYIAAKAAPRRRRKTA